MILIASDHGGFELKENIAAFLIELGQEVEDLGISEAASVDYPDIGTRLAEKISAGTAEAGILLCGAGIGMSIVANKFPNVRAALAHDEYSARMSKEHNNANVLVLGGRTTDEVLARKIVKTWLTAEFEGGRHARRVAKISQIEEALKGALSMPSLEKEDPEIWGEIKNEIQREEENIVLIASENYTSLPVLEAQGSILTNKYAEGYPAHRYYGGCEFVDRIENLAIERAKELFGAEHVNVQPTSGSSANMAAYHALLTPGDTILGMALSHGGHLTHGAPVSFSGRLYKVATYGVSRENQTIDYDEVMAIAKENKPKAVIAGASSYSRTLDFAKFREIADAVGAYLIVDMAHIAGLVAGGAHPSPTPYADIVTSTTHKTLRGPRAGLILCRKEHADLIDKAVFPGLQGGPLMHSIAGKAVAFREAMTPQFKAYAKNVVENAQIMASELTSKGFSIVSGGTDNHLFLIDLTKNEITGLAAETSLDRAGITLNKNSIPFETKSPFVTSGVRIGAQIVTTRGMGPEEMKQIASAIADVLRNCGDVRTENNIREKMRDLCFRFPFYSRIN